MIQEFGKNTRKEWVRIAVLVSLILFGFLQQASAAEWSEVLNKLNSASNSLKSCSLEAQTAPELCMNPMKVICQSPSVTKPPPVISESDASIIQAYQIKRNDPDSSDAKGLLRSELAVLNLIADREQEILKTKNLSPADLDRLFTDLHEGVRASAQKVGLKNLSQAKFFSATTLLAYAKSGKHKADEVAMLVENYLGQCGVTGLKDNASFDYSTRSLSICPGMVQKALEQENGSLTTLGCTLGHELGHSLDRNLLKEKEFALYAPFLACSKEFIDDATQGFNSVGEAKNRLISVYRDYDRRRPAGYPQVLMTAGRGLQNLEAIERVFGLNDKMFSYSNELVADLYCESTLTSQLMKMKATQASAEEKKRFAIQSLSSFCEDLNPVQKQVWGDLQDGVHPPVKYRLENLMRNSEMRDALGCAPLTSADRKACGL